MEMNTESSSWNPENGGNGAPLADQAKEQAGQVVQQTKEAASRVAGQAVEQVKSQIETGKERATGGLDDVAQALHETSQSMRDVKETMGDAAGAVKEAGSTVLEALRENAVPATLIAIGVGWIWASHRGQRGTMRYGRRDEQQNRSPYDESTWRSKPEASSYSQSANSLARQGLMDGEHGTREKLGEIRDQMGRAASQVQETVGEWGVRTRDYARGMTSQCRAMIVERPLAAGAIALGLGAAIGLLIPETYRENRLMGEARDSLVGKVQESAQDLATRAKIVAEEAIDTAKQEARNQDLTG